MKKAIIFAGLFVLAQCLSAKTVKTPSVFTVAGKSVKVYVTAKSDSVPMSYKGELSFENKEQPTERETVVFIDPNKQFQSLLGIGGAVTDAAAEVFAKLPVEKQRLLLEKYYDKEKGIGYSLLRTTIHSCDFSSGSYTYINENDSLLSSFSVKHDMEFRIPLIKRIIDKSGGKITTYASPWSPPA